MSALAECSGGSLRGSSRDGHVAFLGIPYGEAGRFLPPAPAAGWTGVRDATVAGPVAPQDPLVPPPYRAVAPLVEGEDCLSLNVFTPAVDGARRPVLFWIHGGGFSHGAGSQPQYDGGALAERGDVVVVTINYRLGALGYLYLGGHGGDEWGAAVNAGQLDQVLALRWVQENIAAFGGDPANVTIFGQSAGAVAVSTLLAMPAARGLFSKAIAQSGTAGHLGGRDRAAAATAAYLERLGIPGAERDALLGAGVADVLRAQGPRGALSPIVDGDTVPMAPGEALRDGIAAGIPLMIGTARDEQNLYVAGADRAELDEVALERAVQRAIPRRAADRAAEVIDVYRESRRSRGLPSTNHAIVDALVTTSRFRLPALRMAERQAEHEQRTFVYQVDRERGALGAMHGVEVPFVFGNLWPTASDDARRFAHQMMDAWIAFARSGDPSHDGIGAWPAYETSRRHTMVFGNESRAAPAPFEEERAVWASMIEPAKIR